MNPSTTKDTMKKDTTAKQIITGVSAFLIAAAICAFIWWLGGFNFDHRNPDVAFGATMILILSLAAGAMAGIMPWT